MVARQIRIAEERWQGGLDPSGLTMAPAVENMSETNFLNDRFGREADPNLPPRILPTDDRHG